MTRSVVRPSFLGDAKAFFGFGTNPGAVRLVIPSVSQRRAVSLRCLNYPLFSYEISPDDMLCALRLHSLLTKIYGDIVSVVSHTDIRTKPRGHHIFIGGPPTNRFVYGATEGGALRFGRDEISRVIYGPRGEYRIEFSSEDKYNREISADYCLVSRKVSNGSVGLVIAGLRAYGQVASYLFLGEKRFYREAERFSRGRDFQLLLRISVSGSACVGWQIVDWYPRIKDLYEVYLCSGSGLRKEAEWLGRQLLYHGIKAWFAPWDVLPGRSQVNAIEEQLSSAAVKVAVVVFGKGELGGWQEMQLNALLMRLAERSCKVLAVILKDAEEAFELPVLLRDYGAVDLREEGVEELAPVVAVADLLKGDK